MIKQVKISNLDNIELLQKGSSKHEYPNHYHETFCVSIIKSGTLKENEQILPTGAVVISHPFEVHDNELIQDIEYSFTTFYISSDVIRSITKTDFCSFKNKVIYDDKLFKSFDYLANTMLNNSDKAFDNNRFEQRLLTGLKKLTRQYSNTKPFHSSTKPEFIGEIKNHILLNLDSKISLESLAQKVGMSKYQFIRWFKKYVGLTPFDFIILNRVILGKKMIREGKPLLNAAIDTGFYDQSHFSNYFKRFVGLTPKTYQEGCNIFQDN